MKYHTTKFHWVIDRLTLAMAHAVNDRTQSDKSGNNFCRKAVICACILLPVDKYVAIDKPWFRIKIYIFIRIYHTNHTRTRFHSSLAMSLRGFMKFRGNKCPCRHAKLMKPILKVYGIHTGSLWFGKPHCVTVIQICLYIYDVFPGFPQSLCILY